MWNVVEDLITRQRSSQFILRVLIKEIYKVESTVKVLEISKIFAVT